jgi:hypothetical protein
VKGIEDAWALPSKVSEVRPSKSQDSACGSRNYPGHDAEFVVTRGWFFPFAGFDRPGSCQCTSAPYFCGWWGVVHASR